MERDVNILNRVAALLISQGYPEDTIILEWKITSHLRVDIAVIDPASKRPIALFEFKKTKNKQAEHSAKKQLKKYAQVIGDSTIPLYIVFEIDAEPNFELFFLTDENGEEFLKPIDKIPSFASFKNSSISKQLIEVEKKKRTIYDWFKIICWLLAFIIIGLLYLDFKKRINLTPERLGVIAIIVGLIIVPFAKKLNILGVEFERLQDRSPNKK